MFQILLNGFAAEFIIESIFANGDIMHALNAFVLLSEYIGYFNLFAIDFYLYPSYCIISKKYKIAYPTKTNKGIWSLYIYINKSPYIYFPLPC